MSDGLEELGKKLDALRAADEEQKKRQAGEQTDSENMNMGLRAGMELVTSIAAGGFIGWLLDSWLDTQPWFLIVFLIAGIGAGFMGVYRISQNIGHSVGFAPLHKREKQAKNAPEKDLSDNQ